MAKKKQNLSIVKVKKASKDLDLIEQYEIEDGEYKGETISFYTHFSHTKIEEMITEFQQLVLEAQEKELEISDEMYWHLVNFLTIKHFTHFKKDIPSTLLADDTNGGVLDWIEHFRKTGLYKLILDEVFLPSEIKKVMNTISDVTATGLMIGKMEQQIQEKLATLEVKNADVFKEIGKIGKNAPLNKK